MKHDRAAELRAIADGRLLLNVRNGVTVSRSMLAKIADELEAERAAHAETKRERDEALKAMEQRDTDIAEFMGRLGSRWFLEQGWFPKSVGAREDAARRALTGGKNG